MVSKTTVSIFLLLALALCSCARFAGYEAKPGDVLFQDLDSPQGQAVKLATASEYTHCGVVLEVDDDLVVLEAVGPVRFLPIQEWIKQGVGGHFVAKRLDTLYGYLTPKNLAQMKTVGSVHLGKSYDGVFNWSDDQIYCSELVWKVYFEGFGLALCPTRELATYDLSHPAVVQKLQERYGDSVPMAEPVVAPSDLFGSNMLYQVYEN